MSGTGINNVPNVPKCPVPADVVPNLPQCPVPVIPAVYTGRMPRYVPYRTHHSLYAVQRVPLGLSTPPKKGENKNGLERRQKKSVHSRLILVRIRFRTSYFGQVTKINIACLCKLKQVSCAKSDAEIVLCLLVRFFSSSVRVLGRKFKPTSTTDMSGAAPSALRSALDSSIQACAD